MPQLEQITTYASQLFWLALTFGILYITMARIALPKVGQVIEGRREKIRGDLDNASTMTKEAESIEKAYTATMQEAQARSSETVNKAIAAGKAAADARHAELDKVLHANMQEAEKRLAEARTKAVKEVSAASSEIARVVAERVAGVKVSPSASDASVEKQLKQKVA